MLEIIPKAFPFNFEPIKQLFLDLEIIFSLEKKYLTFGLNRERHAVWPSLIELFSIPKVSFLLVNMSIVVFKSNKEFKAPYRDSKPVEPKSEFSKSVFFLSISIGVWSEVTKSIIPSFNPLINAFLCSSDLIGGKTLNLVSKSLSLSSLKKDY